RAARMDGHQPDDSHPSLTDLRVHLTVRLDPDIHEIMKNASERTGVSLNQMINKACREQIIGPGGAARIARERKRPTGRRKGEHVRAAAAYILGYLGNAAQARKAWPWGGRFTVRKGDPDSLVRAGAALAAEYDVRQEGRWGTSASASGA